MKKRTFNKLLDEYKNRVYSYAVYLLRNSEDAEDVTQEVFVKLWKNLDKIDPDRTGAWIMRVAHNQCINMTRKQKTHRSCETHSGEPLFMNMPAREDEITNPELCLETREKNRILLQAMQGLPLKTRSFLLLYYFRGLKYQKISEITDTNVNTVKVEVHRGRKMLKDILAATFPERTGER